VPVSNFSGLDSFTYIVADGHGGSATGLVSITVIPLNYPPVAGGDSTNTFKNVSLILSNAVLLANDVDPDGDVLCITNVGTNSSQGGNVSLGSNAVTYVPVSNFTGLDTFSYIITDGQGGSATGVVSVTVIPFNYPPVA